MAGCNRTRTPSTVPRAELSRRGMREFGLPVTDSWKTANYAYPRGAGADRGKRPSYPINPTHVRAARSYAARADTAGSLSTVDKAIRARYGSVKAAMQAANRVSPLHSRGAGRRAGAGVASTARRGTTRLMARLGPFPPPVTTGVLTPAA